MNIKQIKELIDLMNENNLTEIEVELEGVKVKLTKKPQGTVEQVITPVVQTAQPAASKEEAPKLEEAAKQGKEVKSPMVGTFYRAPSPDDPPYIQVGDIIKKGDVLCIVEAMKLMNEVKADFGGKILEICVENAEAVEFGQTLFLVEPV
ncbi:MAG: acetyl-CoA carboxylase biotin carboxyl carrier protein [Candidatus Omnitrophica bacterium]|nr:acetyl-CoA carboxylase biotin carboxyl carrier protein [Candidatus Omnitrophota bacterium]